MPNTYFKASEADAKFIYEVMEKYHNELYQHKVKLGILFALASEEGHALKHHGYPAAATIRIVPLKDRITKQYDVELMLDADFWRSNEESKKTALIDHELSHVELKRKKPQKPKKRPPGEENESDEQETPPDPKGDVMFDDYNRPMLRTKKGDYNVGDGFLSVIRRHPNAAIETDNLNAALAIMEEALNSVQVKQGE